MWRTQWMKISNWRISNFFFEMFKLLTFFESTLKSYFSIIKYLFNIMTFVNTNKWRLDILQWDTNKPKTFGSWYWNLFNNFSLIMLLLNTKNEKNVLTQVTNCIIVARTENLWIYYASFLLSFCKRSWGSHICFTFWKGKYKL